MKGIQGNLRDISEIVVSYLKTLPKMTVNPAWTLF